jgi:hypothetical protein
MAKYIIVLKPMSAEAVKTACAAVVGAAGKDLTMDWAYVDRATNQPICCWNASDRKSVEELFSRAGQQVESIREVAVYRAPSA